MRERILFVFLLTNLLCSGRVAKHKVVDLGWPFNENTIFWGNSGGFELFNQITIEQPNGDWYASNEFKSMEHGGTHIDAPYHFSKNGWKVGDIPLRNFMATGITIDMSKNCNGSTLLLPIHLIDWEKKHGRIPKNAIILVYFNWSVRYHNKTEYLGGTIPSEYQFPGISPEAAQWIVHNRKIVAIGVDTASIDPGENPDFPAHKIFLNNYIYHLENVKILHPLPPKGFKLVVMPMNIQYGTGAPARIIAYIN